MQRTSFHPDHTDTEDIDMATANLTPIELILTAALSCACQMDSEAIAAWPSIAVSVTSNKHCSRGVFARSRHSPAMEGHAAIASLSI